MQVVGNGFLARYLRPISDRFPEVLAVAAGVSAAADTAQAGFDREVALVHRLIDVCRADGRKLLFFSTAATGMYSIPGPLGTEDGPVRPSTAYGRHKLALEAVLADSGVDHLVLRLGHVVGHRQPPHQLVPSMVRQVLSGEVTLYRGARRDLIDVLDVVTVVDHLLAAGVNGTVVNVVSGVQNRIEDIVDRIERLAGTRAVRRYGELCQTQLVSTERLVSLVPAVAGMGFDERYFERVLDAYVPGYLLAARSAEVAPAVG
jgi:nucleoside-diphosphate-sugar epimerase